MGDDCIFCRIVKGEIPSTKVYEDRDLFAFLDIRPVAPVHVLVVPKKHYATLNDVDDPGVLGHLMAAAREIARREGVADDGYRVVVNTNRNGGQVVFHVHLHVIGGRALSAGMG
jgi:histidine triad (HIT) family protein